MASRLLARSTCRPGIGRIIRPHNNKLTKGINHIQKRFDNGWNWEPIEPDATFLERWAVRDGDFLIQVMMDMGLTFPWFISFIYYWMIEDDESKIEYFNTWHPPRYVP